jgi:hypothetical protein
MAGVVSRIRGAVQGTVRVLIDFVDSVADALAGKERHGEFLIGAPRQMRTAARLVGGKTGARAWPAVCPMD